MDRIDNLKDETIRTLAQTLKQSGLAASEGEAIRMATNMSQTNKKANDTFESRKEKNTMGLSFLHKENKEKNQNQEVVKEEVFAEDKPKEEASLEEHECTSCSDCESEINEEKPLNDLFNVETKDEFIEQDLIKEEPKKEEQPETTQEIPVSNDKPKKDLSQYKESEVDLSSVFKFN